MSAVILAKDGQAWLSEYAFELRAELQLLNIPFTQWQAAALRSGGIADISLVQLGDKPLVSVTQNMRVRVQSVASGSGGSLAQLRTQLPQQAILVCAGSAFIDPQDVQALLTAGRIARPGWGAIVGVIEPSTRFEAREIVDLDSAGQLRQIYRGHTSQDRRRHRRLSGLMLLAPDALHLIPDAGYFDIKEQLFPKLQATGLRIDSVPSVGSFSVLTPEDYLRVQIDLLNEFRMPGMREALEPRRPTSARIDDKAELLGRVDLGHDSCIEAGARIIGPVIIGDRCRVAAGATIVGPSVLGHDCNIGAGSVIQCSALADGVITRSGSSVQFSLLGPKHEVRVWQKRYYVDALCGWGIGTRRGSMLGGHRRGMKRVHGVRDVVSYLLDSVSKRAFDIAIASVLLVLTAGFWLGIALAVRLDSPGPAFFAQRRCGLNGEEFFLLKFRTMVTGAETMKQLLDQSNEVDGPMFKLTNDPRVTRIGAFLRRTSLDELPQLINVLRGEMSLVGPRPLAMSEMTLDPHWRDARLSVKPGITGLWQVYGRTAHAFHTWIAMDMEYVRARSFWLDLKIMAMTFLAVFRGS